MVQTVQRNKWYRAVTIYMYGSCCRDMKVCLPEEVIFHEGEPQEKFMTSEGKQTFISPYNIDHKLFIIPKLHNQQYKFFLN